MPKQILEPIQPWGPHGSTFEVGQRDAATGRVAVRLPTGLIRSGSRTPFEDMLREWQAEQAKPDNPAGGNHGTDD